MEVRTGFKFKPLFFLRDARLPCGRPFLLADEEGRGRREGARASPPRAKPLNALEGGLRDAARQAASRGRSRGGNDDGD